MFLLYNVSWSTYTADPMSKERLSFLVMYPLHKCEDADINNLVVGPLQYSPVWRGEVSLFVSSECCLSWAKEASRNLNPTGQVWLESVTSYSVVTIYTEPWLRGRNFAYDLTSHHTWVSLWYCWLLWYKKIQSCYIYRYICSWTSCPNLKYAYTSWKIPLFLCTEKLMTCREDKLVSFIRKSFAPKHNVSWKAWSCIFVNNLKFGRPVTQTINQHSWYSFTELSKYFQ